MRKPYALPEQYADWDTEILKEYASNLVYMITKMHSKHGVKSAFDRHVFGNVYDELHAIKTLLDERVHVYASKFLVRRLYGILGEELAAYDKQGREGRLMRKQLDARRRNCR